MKNINQMGINNLLNLVNPHRKAQHLQALFVLSELDYKFDGFFVEFGAADSLTISNTWLLEKYFNWHGILAEPAKIWHERLGANRNCIIDTKCVWKESGQNIFFNQTESPELSKINLVIVEDWAKVIREINATHYSVQTIALNDLLSEYQVPDEIVYITVDTESSEFHIFETFDFNRYKVKLCTIENNLKQKNGNISEPMFSINYRGAYEDISEYDDWYSLIN